MDIENFDNFTFEEYRENLKRLKIKNHKDLIGETVYYVTEKYGEHIVEKWNEKTGEYLLNLDGDKFHSNPFRIIKYEQRS